MNRNRNLLTIIAGCAFFLCASFLLVQTAIAYSPILRTAVPLDEKLSEQKSNTYLWPKTIAVTKISPEKGVSFGESSEWYQGFYYYCITKLGFTDVPFNYVVTWDGSVYVGKGGGKDVVPLVSAEKTVGISRPIIIAYFDNNREIPSSSEIALNQLITALQREYGISKSAIYAVDSKLVKGKDQFKLSSLALTMTSSNAWNSFVGGLGSSSLSRLNRVYNGKVEQVTYESSVEGGKHFMVKVKIKNLGDHPWYNSGATSVYLSTSNPRSHKSPFFVSDKWASFARVVEPTKEWILPNEIADFEFEIATPLIPGNYKETFELLELPGNWIPGTQFEVKFSVKKGAYSLVKILSTNTGYLNVRDCPATDCKELGKVVPGDILISLGKQDAWYHVRLDNGKTGWVFARYVKEL